MISSTTLSSLHLIIFVYNILLLVTNVVSKNHDCLLLIISDHLSNPKILLSITSLHFEKITIDN